MAAKGYCSTGDVSGFLNRDFTAQQLAICAGLIEAAEIRFDAETSRGFLVGTQTAEAHFPESRNVYLKYAPVSSVTTITGRTDLGEAETAMVADTDYEVRDLNAGHIYLEFPTLYERILVTYEPVDTVPALVKQAVVEIVAAWMLPQLHPGAYGLDSYSLPDLTVRFARSHVQNSLPPNAAEIIELYHYPTGE